MIRNIEMTVNDSETVYLKQSQWTRSSLTCGHTIFTVPSHNQRCRCDLQCHLVQRTAKAASPCIMYDPGNHVTCQILHDILSITKQPIISTQVATPKQCANKHFRFGTARKATLLLVWTPKLPLFCNVFHTQNW